MEKIILNGVEYELKETGNSMLSGPQCPCQPDECYEEEIVCKSYKDMIEQANNDMYDFNNSHRLFTLYAHRDEDFSFDVLAFRGLADKCLPIECLENNIPFDYTGNAIIDGARILKANIEANKEELNEVISKYGIGSVINAAYLAGASSAMLHIGNIVLNNSSTVMQYYVDSAAEYIKEHRNTQKASIVEPLPLKTLPPVPVPFKRRK